MDRSAISAASPRMVPRGISNATETEIDDAYPDGRIWLTDAEMVSEALFRRKVSSNTMLLFSDLRAWMQEWYL